MPGNQLVQSLLRGMDVFQAVADLGGVARLSGLGQKLGMKPPTVHNLVRTLKSRGFLEQVAGSTEYRLGPTIYALVAQGEQDRLFVVSEPVIRKLGHDLPNAVITLSQPAGGEIRARLRLSPDRPGIMQKPLDHWFAPYATASGLLFLALLQDEQRMLLEQRYPFDEFGAHLWGLPESLGKYLQKVRKQKSALHPFAGKSHFAVAIPVYTQDQAVLACLGASMPLAPKLKDKTIRLLTRAANRIQRDLTNRPINR